MEFPHIGKHCSEPTCNRLDFLPVKCDACGGTFCHTHMSYDAHNCTEGKMRDFQVPVCPLCSKPVPSKRGEAPDIAVGAHIDADCESDKATKRRKVFSNRCNFKNCKKKEMIPLKCSQCNKNHCLSHRHPADHQCNPAQLMNSRIVPKKSGKTQPAPAQHYQKNSQYVQGSLSEDEALARAIQLSLATGSGTSTASNNQQAPRSSSQQNSNCNLS